MRIIFIFLFTAFIYSCTSSPKTNGNFSRLSQLEEIKEHLKYQQQLESEEKEFENPYKLSEKDLLLAIDVENEGLIKNGFRKLNKETFENKILEIFGIAINPADCNKVKITDSLITYYGSDLDGTTKTLVENEFELQSITNNLFFSRSNIFFTHMYLLKELVVIEDDTYKLIVPQQMIARNKYLLNDDKSLFTWLIVNDEIFMKNLLIQFGYTKDKELLHWII